MSDDKRKTGQHDRIRVNVNQAYELRHWTRAFGIKALYLREAVRAVGPLVEDVKRYLIERIEKAQ